MQVIQTHEQSDFDAVAALLGAYLLNEHAVPVLPRRLNRNVRAFIDLYGIELPFVNADQLPPEPIDAITLVDTQSMVTLKNTARGASVCVVDHHPLREGLSPEWEVRIERLGATTTLFVEQLLEHNGQHLNVIHATLLLLGIYEDTGSLSYAATTARDLRAAAALLDHGANLGIATDFLNPPLSRDQRRLYNLLLQSAESLKIHGQRITLCRGDARDMDEEISSVAHKLRDLLDPDGLVLLVSTKEGTRMVCRSTTDQVNVATLAAHFGGGGHERASAALMRPAGSGSLSDEAAAQHLEKMYRELKKVLPNHVRAPITVRQIMSTSPMTLAPETPVREAASLMQRYGYEGYPVVQNNQVIGLLTRRAVDRALAHNLDLTAESLMEAGEVTVRRSDSLEQLQRIMSSSGWGQVPVIDPESKEIIGIVTRTDLLKMLGGAQSGPLHPQNLAIRLGEALPKARLALLKRIAGSAHEHHMAVYIVGGFVRDLLLHRPGLDFDVVVEGNAIELAEALAAELGGRVTSHKRFGTAKWMIADIRAQLAESLADGGDFEVEDLPESLDLISARTEYYTQPTALPTVLRGSIKLDLHRRDFTINTLALRLDGSHYGELYDYWGGVLDLQNGLVRVLHSLSFIDDPTRMLRAVRFEQRFSFHIEARTLQLIEEARTLLHQISGQRLRHEFDLIFSEPRADAMLARLAELDLLSAIHPELTWRAEWRAALHSAQDGTAQAAFGLPDELSGQPVRRMLCYLVWLQHLPQDVLDALEDQLHFPGVTGSALHSASRLHACLGGLVGQPPSAVTAQLENVPLVVLAALHLMEPDAAVRSLIERYVSTWQHVQPTLDGDALRALGIKPGPVYKLILTTLRNAWLDGKIHNIEEEQQLFEQTLHEAHPSDA